MVLYTQDCVLGYSQPSLAGLRHRTSHLEDSLASLSIVPAADQAMRTGQPVDLSDCAFSLHPA
jgi:hypothetical protein